MTGSSKRDDSAVNCRDQNVLYMRRRSLKSAENQWFDGVTESVFAAVQQTFAVDGRRGHRVALRLPTKNVESQSSTTAIARQPHGTRLPGLSNDVSTLRCATNVSVSRFASRSAIDRSSWAKSKLRRQRTCRTFEGGNVTDLQPGDVFCNGPLKNVLLLFQANP